jgi:small redox-active disulfide protein 2
MLNIKILGTGCTRCKTLEKKVRDLAELNNIQAEVLKIEDLTQIMSYSVLATPGLVINEEVKCYGSIPKDEQIITWLKESK